MFSGRDPRSWRTLATMAITCLGVALGACSGSSNRPRYGASQVFVQRDGTYKANPPPAAPAPAAAAPPGAPPSGPSPSQPLAATPTPPPAATAAPAAAAPPTPPAAPARTPPPRAPTPPAVSKAAPASGRQHWVAPPRDVLSFDAFDSGPDYQLRQVRQQPTAQLLAGGAVGGEVSPDGSRVLVVPLRRGARLVPGGSIQAGDVTRTGFSPDGRFVWLLDEQSQVTVVNAANAQILRTYSGADDPAFASGGRIAFRRGCQAYVDTLTGSSNPQPVGRPVCGEVIRLDADAREVVLLDEGIIRFGTATGYERVCRVELDSATWHPLFEYGVDIYYISPRISDGGERTCAIKVDHHQFMLQCRSRGQAEPDYVYAYSTTRIHDLDEKGDLVLFEGSSKGRKNALLLADYRTRTVRFIRDTGYLFWRFFPGARRLIGRRSGQAIIVDLDAGWEMKVGRPHEEWDGFGAIPGRVDRFLLGRERGGGRDLFWVTMPKEVR